MIPDQSPSDWGFGGEAPNIHEERGVLRPTVTLPFQESLRGPIRVLVLHLFGSRSKPWTLARKLFLFLGQNPDDFDQANL